MQLKIFCLTLCTSLITSVSIINPTKAVQRLSGAGASLPAMLYSRLFSDLRNSGGPKVNYQAAGSGFALKALIDESVDFAASDYPINTNKSNQIKRGIVQIPIVAGNIAIGYNKPNCDLALTQEQLVGIAMGIIKDWAEVNCTQGKITWIHRSDASGSTKAFTKSMQSFSKTWTLGSAKTIEWPTGIGTKGTSGVAGRIKNIPGSIGYLSSSYLNKNIQTAAIENLSGEFLKPTIESGSIALKDLDIKNKLAQINPNPKEKGAYPISTLTWIWVYKKGYGEKLNNIKTTLNFLLSDEANKKALKLGFIPLNKKLQDRAITSIRDLGI
tara:strand:- start:1231 stop:2211 length:981 start_codon:yes stop_codon:yes gene_type:complete